MSYHNRLVEEINREIDDRVAKKQPLVGLLITHAICASHREALV